MTMFLKRFSFSRSKHTSSSGRQYPTVLEELCHQFSLADLRKATNKFDQNRIIGSIYKGCLKHKDGSEYTVAVKLFDVKTNHEREAFNNEIVLLCQLRHPNVVTLIGFCNHKMGKIIVYEYMSNRSLYERLQDVELPWKKRLEICIGVPRGLHYLHAGVKRTIIHRYIKLHNILSDDNMKPNLADFAITIQGAHFKSKPKPIQIDSIVGTMGYMAMEYFTQGIVTDKCDVFSFGVVLLEVVYGGKYVAERELMEDHIDFNKIDPRIKGKIAPECWQVFIDIALRCLNNEIEVELEHALSLQEQADITNTDGEYTFL